MTNRTKHLMYYRKKFTKMKLHFAFIKKTQMPVHM